MPTLAYSNSQTASVVTNPTLTSTSFTPQTGDIIVVKGISADANQTWGTPAGGGWTYTKQITDVTSSHVGAGLWTAPVTAGGTAQTVSVTVTGNGASAQMTVELWRNAQLAGTPATVDARGSGAPSTPITTVAANSVVSWANGDWAAVDGASRTYNTTSATPTEDGYFFSSGQATAYSAYQTAATAGSQTLGLTAPTGQTWTLIGIEIQDSPLVAGAGGAAAPGRTWLRRFHHRQAPLFPSGAVSAPVAGPPVYPLGHPVQARQLPQRGGFAVSRDGIFRQAGPPVKPADSPVRAQPQKPFLTGRTVSRDGLYAGNGPPVHALDSPVHAQPQKPVLTGRANSRDGIFAQAGPPVRRWNGPVQAHQLPQRGGRIQARTGIYTSTVPGSGPPVYPLRRPVQARLPLPSPGRALASGAIPGPAGVPPVSGPPVRALDGPVRAQPQKPLLTGRADGRTGTYAGSGPPVLPLTQPAGSRNVLFRTGTAQALQAIAAMTGPPVRQWDSPVQARQPLPPRGRIQSRDGTFTAVAGGSGPPVYPLHGPVQARRLPRRGGSAVSRDGTFSGTGPAVRQWDGPVQARQPLPPRGRIQARSGTYTLVIIGAGPPVYPLGHPVQARQPLPPRGRVIKAAGTYGGTGPRARQWNSPFQARQPLPPRGRADGTAGPYGRTGPPVRIWDSPIGIGRQQPPPPNRGRTASLRGPYGQTGPPVIRLRRQVRGQPQVPLLTGRASSREGVWSAPAGLFQGTSTATVGEAASMLATVSEGVIMDAEVTGAVSSGGVS